MAMKVLVTPRSFGKENPALFVELEEGGCEVVRNNTGKILDADSMKKLLADCDGIIVGIDPLNREVLDAAPRLRVISKYGVGLDNVDLEECKRRGIKVFRTTGANSNAVADYAFALMLGVARRVVDIDRRCRNSDWGKITTIDVHAKTLGIIGLGEIGKRVAQRASGFEMRVLAADEVWDKDFALKYDIVQSDVDRICREADFISLHCTLTDSSRNIINAERIAQMKPNAVIVNTARGGLIDENALFDALKNNRIWGAGLDVFEHEPPENKEWFKLDNVIFGSHCSASTKGAVEAMGSMAVRNLLRGLASEKY